jgi:hypothetical protein
MSKSRHWIALAAIVTTSGLSLFSQHSEPPLALAERPGGSAIYGAVSDGEGGLWAVGSAGPSFAASPDAFKASSDGTDGFLMHLAADGTRLYATYLGGTRVDQANAIARDTAGNLYVTGQTNSTDFPTTTGAYKQGMPSESFGTAFVMKLDPSGKRLLYSTYLGGRRYDAAFGIAVDAAGNAHVVGMTQGFGYPYTWSRCLDYLTSQQSSFYTRLSANGDAILFSTCLDDSWARGVTLDSSGNAYVVGSAWRSFGPRMGSDVVIYPQNGSGMGFLAKFSPDRSQPLPFSMYIGGDGSYDTANGVAVTSKGIYIAGSGISQNYPGAPPRNAPKRPVTLPDGRIVMVDDVTSWITKVSLDGTQILGTTVIDGDGISESAQALQVDASEVVHVAGWTNSSSFRTAAAPQRAFAGGTDAWYAQAWMPNNVVGDPGYITFLGGSRLDHAGTLVLDGSGGAWLGGHSDSPDFPDVNAKTASAQPAFVARFGQPAAPPPAAAPDVVLHAHNASTIVGNWQQVADSTAAGGARLWNPDAGVPKIGTASASPANFFELTFHADAGVPYYLWLRMKADNDHWTNDSVFVQFSDSVDGGGHPIWRTGTTSAATVSLEDCTGCGESGWGWNNNGYNTAAPAVIFASSGSHTIRIQQREDGISIDQVVLSRQAHVNTAPGAPKDDATILAESNGGPSEPPPPPPSDPREVVMYVAGERLAGGQNWIVTSDPTAAGGARLLNADLGQAKSSSPSVSGSDYFEVQFTAEAGVPYHLWVRSQATNDHWTNDSVFVQFSDSVDASGTPIFRVGTDHATYVSLEDCSGCGEQGWGWNDNAYGAFAAPIYFAKSGPQTIRVLRREDGISIDQIVLSAGKYVNASPGLAKNDTTIVPK